jgi:hypothetical protein
MSENKKWLSPSDEESEEVANKIKNEIFPIIDTIDTDNHSVPKIVKIVFEALQVGNKMLRENNKEFELKNPDNLTHVYHVRLDSIIATCLACKLISADIDDYHPHSQASSYFQAFSSVCSLIEASGNLELLTECDSDFSYCSELAKEVFEKSRRARDA